MPGDLNSWLRAYRPAPSQRLRLELVSVARFPAGLARSLVSPLPEDQSPQLPRRPVALRLHRNAEGRWHHFGRSFRALVQAARRLVVGSPRTAAATSCVPVPSSSLKSSGSTALFPLRREAGPMGEKPTSLDALIEWVKLCSGADREVDVLVALAAGGADGEASPLQGYIQDGPGSHYRVKEYTASIDAALALAERLLPGWEWQAENVEGRPYARLAPPRSVPWQAQAEAATVPLAIVLATLIAHRSTIAKEPPE